MKPSFFAPLTLYITILFLQQISSSAESIRPETACAHTEAPDLCISVIKSDPRSINGNLREYCVIVLEKVLSKASGRLKSSCPKAYKKLVADVGEAIVKLQTEQPAATVVGIVKSAIKDVGSCFRADPSLLKLLQIALSILKIIK